MKFSLPTQRITLSVLLFLGIFLAWGGWWYFGKGPIGASDGLPFFREVKISIPHFAQADPRWAQDLLGGIRGDSLASAGCAVSSAAMVLAYRGAFVTPQSLNTFLKTIPGGYTPQGWIEWQKAAEVAPYLTSQLLPHYENAPSRFLMDWNLLHGNPLIVRLASRQILGGKHFMVIVGKRGWDYLVQDPGEMGNNGIYPLKNYCHRIEALRFYRY